MAAAPGSNVTIASFYWGTDDCVAIQNAINAAVVGSQLRGGALSTILFPPGGYMIYNANGLTNNVWHSVLHTTRAAAYPLGSASIQFLGFGSVGVPAGWYVNGVTVGWTPTFNGSVLYCPYNAYDGLNPGTGNVPSFFACDDFAGNGFQDIYVKIKDITLRTPTPTGLSGFDLSHASVAEVDGLIVDVDYVTPQDMTSIITGTAVGLIMPRVDNGAYSNIRTYACIGQYVGILGGEHTHIDYAVIFKCERGLQVNAPQNHMVTFDHLGVFHCHWALVAGGTGTAVLSGKLNVERDTLAPQAFQYDVYDPNNNFYGNVQYLSVTTGTGARNAATVNSTANLTLVRLA